MVAVAQLLERSLPTPEVHGSNPVIGEVLLSIVNCIEKTKIKKKRPGMALLKKRKNILTYLIKFDLLYSRNSFRYNISRPQVMNVHFAYLTIL